MRRLISSLILVVFAAVAMQGFALAQPKPEFKLGFKALADLAPEVVGEPVEDERHNILNGDALQQTTRGLMVWRKADNWTAFTDGSRTWINGPFGLQARGNDERFPWEMETTTPPPSPRTAPSPTTTPPASERITPLHGLSFSPWVDGQDPNLGWVVGEEQLTARMRLVAPDTRWIRTYGSSNGLERAGRIAHSLGLKAAVGAWLGRDLAANEREIDNLIRAAKTGDVDMAIVGSEVLLRGDLTEPQLIGYIERVKREAPGVPVTTGEVYHVILSHPALVAAVDLVLAHYYPFWEGVKIGDAMGALDGWHRQVVVAAAGKPVVVGETGWPGGGDPHGQAVPSLENARSYLLGFLSWARANNVDYFYFEAFDESWKSAYEGSRGAHWGIWDKDGKLKPGIGDAFRGPLAAAATPTPTAPAIPGGPGKPALELTRVPAYGSTDDLEGRVLHVNPADYKVAVYIYVSGWWTKPYFASPLTTIRRDGTWSCDVTTGGLDRQAIRIAAYLVPAGYSPPLMSGGAALPPELEARSVARAEVSRASN